MEYLVNLAENTSVRVNLLYASGAYCFGYAYWHSFLSGGGILSFLLYFLSAALVFAVLAGASLLAFGCLMFAYSWSTSTDEPVDWTKYIECTDSEILSKYSNKKIPMETFVEAYLSSKCDFKGDLHETLEKHRNELFRFVFTKGHLNYFYQTFVRQTFGHTAKADATDVQGTYNLGNDFYNAFLGPSMVYTCAIFNEPEKETLEEAQRNKIDFVCKKIELKKDEKHIDIGCGWGTFVAHAAANYGSNSLGITIAQEQIDWGKKRIAELPAEVRDKARVELMDYRDIPPNAKYDKITCLEMAEHVGIKNFQKFCRQLFNMLNDDGTLYIQMCGLRPSWQLEDLVWGLFMAKYIFPGADASCPAGWVAHQLEKAGLEVHTVETVTYHYAITIKRWYDSWKQNKQKIVANYGERQWRLYYLFLGWSVLIARQGTSACHQIVAHKNLNKYDRGQYIGKVGVPGPFTGGSKPYTENPANAFSKDK